VVSAAGNAIINAPERGEVRLGGADCVTSLALIALDEKLKKEEEACLDFC